MASTLQGYLEKMFGVRLAVNPHGSSASESTGNVILLGRKACLAAGRVDDKELRHVGPEGFVINAHNGRIAIAGSGDDGTIDGVIRYLEDHGLRFCQPGRPCVPKLSHRMLHELYLLDRPYFRNRTVRLDWRCDGPMEATETGEADARSAAQELASAIKELARAGRRELPSSLSATANQSPLSRYVAAKLFWDPFSDATRLIGEFLDPCAANDRVSRPVSRPSRWSASRFSQASLNKER